MPSLTEEQIKEFISSGKIQAISIDTAVFDRFNCDLESMTLIKLDQFKKGGIDLLLSEIVVREITKHIDRDALETQRSLWSALKKHIDRWNSQIDVDALKKTLELTTESAYFAKTKVQNYLTAIQAEVIPANGRGNLAEKVLAKYFDTVAPFEEKKEKKHEFPDAFALLSLEQAAMERKTLLICISPDKGWASFAASSEHLIVVSDINDVLTWFNADDSFITERAFSIWKNGGVPNLDEEIANAFEYHLDGLRYEIDGYAPFSYEAEPLSAVLQNIDKNEVRGPSIIDGDEETVTFAILVTAKIGFEAQFDFYVTDSIDKDDINLGSEVFYVEKDFDFEVVISIGRYFEEESFDIIKVSVTPSRINVNFGFLDPFSKEDPTHEKY